MSTYLYTVTAEKQLGFILIVCLKATTLAESQTFVVQSITTITLDNVHTMKRQFASQPLFIWKNLLRRGNLTSLLILLGAESNLVLILLSNLPYKEEKVSLPVFIEIL